MATTYKNGDYYNDTDSGKYMVYQDGSWVPQTSITLQNKQVPKPANAPVVTTDPDDPNAAPTVTNPDNLQIIKLKAPAVPAKGSSYRYPNNIKDKHTDYVMFEFGAYIPPYAGDPEGARDNSDEAKAPTDRSKYQNYNASANAFQPYTDSDLKPIILYMPQDIQTESKQNWNGKAISNLGGAGLGLFGGNADKLKNYNFGQGMQSAVSALVTAALNAVPGVGGNFTLNDVLGSTQGVILNPNVEILYDSLELREFTLKFKMTPHDGNESLTIKKIVQVFRKASMPSYNGTSGSNLTTTNAEALRGSNVIGLPSMCRVSFMRGSELHSWLPQYKTCAIQKVTVNYTPDGAYATFGDGSPVATELTVSFLESKLLFAEEINISGASY